MGRNCWGPLPRHPRSAAGRPDLRSPAGASAAAGARAERRPAAAPGPARPPLPTPSGCSPHRPDSQGAPRAGLASPRGDAGKRRPLASGPRAPPHPTPPPAHGGRADKGASWRPRLAVAVGGLNPAPGLTFGAASTLAPRACSPDRPHGPAPQIHRPRPSPAAQRPPTHLREPKGSWVEGHLRHKCRGGLPAFSVPSLWRRQLPDSSERGGPPH